MLSTPAMEAAAAAGLQGYPTVVESDVPACLQGGEMSEEQYNAMTPEQQAAYWHQWQQYTSQQYQGAAPEQAHLDPNAHYAQDPNYQAYYAQYQVRPWTCHIASALQLLHLQVMQKLHVNGPESACRLTWCYRHSSRALPWMAMLGESWDDLAAHCPCSLVSTATHP